jgi:hypothetical protein
MNIVEIHVVNFLLHEAALQDQIQQKKFSGKSYLIIQLDQNQDPDENRLDPQHCLKHSIRLHCFIKQRRAFVNALKCLVTMNTMKSGKISRRTRKFIAPILTYYY